MRSLDHRTSIGVLLVSVLLAGGSLHARQASVSSGDVQRLQQSLDDVTYELGRLRNSDATLAARLESEAADLRDEVTYFRVKLRRDGVIEWREYTQLRDQIDGVLRRARGTGVERDGSASTGAEGAGSPDGYGTGSGAMSTDPYTVDAGQQLDVKLLSPLSSSTARIEDRVDAETMVDLFKNDRLLVPAGSRVRGVVTSVSRASRSERKGSLTLSFDEIDIDGTRYPLRARVLEALESEGLKGEARRIGTGASVGAVIGGILGGVKGALLGILIGGGGTIAATEGKNVDLEPGTIFRIELDSPLTLSHTSPTRGR